MALSRAHRREDVNFWPGFVDALSTMLIGIVFLLTVFVLGQFFLSQEITGKDTALERLNKQISELTDLLALERSSNRQAQESLQLMQSTLAQSQGERSRLQGLLDGQQAVVHWAARNLYASLFPAVDWSIDRVVHSGNGIYTSGGAFSAAHLVLHLIEKYTDRDTAIWCAKYFQLDWSRQSQLPFSVFMGQKAHADQVVRAVQDFIESRYTEKITVEDLADRHALGRRTLERRFRQATGNSIVEYVQRVRVEAAKRRLESSRKSVSEVMYEVGYNDTKAFRDIFNKYCGMSPVGYRERYQ